MIRRLVFNSVLITIALVLGFFESFFPIAGIIPGGKIGISNISPLFALMFLSFADALIIFVSKIFLSAFLYAGISSIPYALTGALCSLLIMLLLKRFFYPRFITAVGISIAGSALFNTGQLIAGVFILGTSAVLTYLPVLLLFSVGTGFLTGFVVVLIGGRLGRLCEIKIS